MSFARACLSTLIVAFCWTSVGLFAQVRAATAGLSGTLWRLVQFQGADGRTLTSESGTPFTVEFRTDNTVAVQLDCHRGRGTWVSRSTSQLEMGPLALTRATCPQTPLRDQVAQQWASIRSYTLRDMHLFLLANGGTYEFAPANSVSPHDVTPQLPHDTAVQPPHDATPQSPHDTAVQPPHDVARQPPHDTAAQPPHASWLDASKPVSWNQQGATIPQAPRTDGAVDPRCGALARTPELAADKQLVGLGWDLIGAYQGGWGILVIQAAAGYDGMCRPRSYQAFVFLHGVFAGTLSPRPMDARADGALNRVTLQDDRRLVAQYARYAASDALCCPSRTTSVVFQIVADEAVVQPVSTNTSSNR